MPRWRQVGEDDTVKFNDQYLAIKINEANVFRDINDGGDAAAWVEINWGGTTKKTREFKKTFVNQTLYFKIPIPPSKKSGDKVERYLTEELGTKTEFEISVWADTCKMTIDNIGNAKVCLSHIGENNNNYQDLEFVDPLTKTKTNY